MLRYCFALEAPWKTLGCCIAGSAPPYRQQGYRWGIAKHGLLSRSSESTHYIMQSRYVNHSTRERDNCRGCIVGKFDEESWPTAVRLATAFIIQQQYSTIAFLLIRRRYFLRHAGRVCHCSMSAAKLLLVLQYLAPSTGGITCRHKRVAVRRFSIMYLSRCMLCQAWWCTTSASSDTPDVAVPPVTDYFSFMNNEPPPFNRVLTVVCSATCEKVNQTSAQPKPFNQ